MKTIKIFLITAIALFFAISGSLYAQTGSISGVLHDGTGSPLSGVNIILVGTTQGAITNMYGEFTFPAVTPGTYTLQVTTLSINVVVLANQNTLVYAPGTPTLTTAAATNITGTSAQIGGDISTDNGSPVTTRGICWSTSPNPDLSNNTTKDGGGIGSYTSSLTNLTPNTSYYVKAYATSSLGPSLGNEISFTTACPQINIYESIKNVSCNGYDDGAIYITVSGGTVPYTYLWNNGSTTEDISSLTPGSYSVTVTDANNCTAVKNNMEVTEPAVISIDGIVTDILCYGGDNGTINITVSGGNIPYTYLWNHGPTTEDVSSLTAGSYNITVTDTLGCTNNSTFNISEPDAISIEGVVTDVLCYGDNDGAIDITVSGGVAPYSYSWNNESSDEDQTDLTAGPYNVTVTDNNSCTAFVSYNISEPDALSIVVDNITNETCTGCSDGAIEITVSGGTPGYSYEWKGPDGYSSTDEDPGVLGAGVYFITVNDNNACMRMDSAEVINPLIVTNTDDDGMGSLRNAITYANSHEGRDSIIFNIPGPGPHTIQPATLFPTITEAVVIDGYTQSGASSNSNSPGQGLNTVLMIEIDGSNPGSPETGLFLAAGNSTIRGIVFNRFSNRGIALWENNGNIIEGNFFGTDIYGSDNPGFGNGVFGIEIRKSDDNIIRGNVISGNGGTDPNPGIVIYDGSTGNQLLGNFIGTDISGILPLPNSGSAINIGNSPNNTIGGTKPEDRNIIFGGIALAGQSTTGNKILGNYIGPDVTGNTALGDGGGIVIYDEATDNEIGPGNVISGIQIGNPVVLGAGTYHNRVFGNMIGVNADGSAVLSNQTTGIIIENSSYNRIGGLSSDSTNVISGSEQDDGIRILGETATGNHIVGNYIGTNALGNQRIDNKGCGIHIADSANNNVIGPGNLISGNSSSGIIIFNEESRGNKIIGNKIGTDLSGQDTIPNYAGIEINNAQETTIGGLSKEESNLISGNNGPGIVIKGDTANRNTVIGNYIGTNIDGDQAIPNNQGVLIQGGNYNIVGGSGEEARNIISGNTDNGVWIDGAGYSGAYGNKVQGNYIGLTANGTDPLGNIAFGVKISYAWGNLIGGPDPGHRNVISDNGSIDPPRHGIHIEFSDSGNVVQGNYVGTDATGMNGLGNKYMGIMMYYASHNIIINNLVSDNSDGIYIYTGPIQINADHNIIQGNMIGTNANGTGSLGNKDDGVGIQGGKYNLIGGTKPEERNVISGNRIGIRILSSKASLNSIKGNYIGTDISGTFSLPNTQHGIYVYGGTSNNTIGGTTSSERNIISGNGNDMYCHGIVISDSLTTGNKISGNFIGLDVSGKTALGNKGDGIQIINNASGNSIGGINPGERNVIAGNEVTGIAIYNSAFANRVLGNFIGLDASGVKNIGHPGGTGVYMGVGASNNIIGGTQPGEGNFISGNTGWAGVAIHDTGTVNNKVIGNLMGINVKGEQGYGNRRGVLIYNGASHNQIGGMERREGNLIAYSNEEGVVIFDIETTVLPSTGNLILSNLIHGNGSLGIDLGYDGVTENDEGDIDSSPNNLQNYPVLESISFSPGTVTVVGTLNSAPETEFILQFFASKMGDPTTYGEGQTYLGSEMVTTDGQGDASFTCTFPILGTSGQIITATATDPDGNTSEFSKSIGGVKDHILANMNQPFYYSINKDGVPNIFDGSDLDAVRSAFQTWTDVPTANIEFIDNGITTATYASATDGVNLVTFSDEKFPFAPGVLAIAAKTLRIDPSGQTAEIIDADIVFNPQYVNHTEYNLGVGNEGINAGFFDIQSVTTHEIGHILGLIHTGVVNSTMFFMISTGTELRSLEKDDIAWISYRYPAQNYYSSFGSISGRVTYGEIGDINQPETHPPVAGALVLAINTETNEKIHAYTDADGRYTVPVPAGSDGSVPYWIYIQPLDGDVFGYNLKPGNISSYIYSNTIYTDFPNEWWDTEEGPLDNPDKATVIEVSAGVAVNDIDLITNKDIIQPVVESITPSDGSTGFHILDPLIIVFSEPIDLNSISEDNCYLTYELDGNTIYVQGDAKVPDNTSEKVIFSLREALRYSTEYTIHIETDGPDLQGIYDLKGNVLYETITSIFTTEAGDNDPPGITGIIPKADAEGVFVTDEVIVIFSESMDRIHTEEGFTLSCEDTPEVEGAFKWTKENDVMTFVPLWSLKENMTYTITLTTDITDLSGNSLPGDSVCSFSTVTVANPVITYIGPGDGEDNVTVETPIVVDFSEPVNTKTINPATFRLLASSGQVAGTFEFLLEDSRVVFRPDMALYFNQIYTIELTIGIYDVSQPALQLENDLVSSFTTCAEPVLPHITYIDPPSGVFGSVITIAGTGFDPVPVNNTVTFNGTKAVIIKSSLSNIAVEVPMGVLSGPVNVSVNGETSNPMYFYVIPQSLDPCEEIIANANTGAGSGDVAVNPEAGLAYVTNSGSGTVSVIDINKDIPEVINTITVGETPLKIDINPQLTFAYVTNFSSHTVSVINLNTYEVETIYVGINPYGVVVGPDGKVYVSNYTSEDVSVIDVDPESGGFNHVVANINTGARNTDLDITPDAAFLLVAGYNGLTIISINPADEDFNAVIAHANSGTRTGDVTVTPEAGLAIVSTLDGDLFIVDIYPASDNFGTVLANIHTGSGSGDVKVSPEALFVYVTNKDGSVSVYRLEYGGGPNANASYFWNIALTLHATIEADDIGADELKGLTIDPDANFLYVVDPDYENGNGRLTKIGICCGPVPVLKSIGDLIINVQNLVNSGTISYLQGKLLTYKLYEALKYLDKDRIGLAILNLRGFINNLKIMMYFDRIPEDQALSMIEATEAIIEELYELLFKHNENLKSYILSTEELDMNESFEAALGMIYPNPFSESVTIHYEVPSGLAPDAKVYLLVYNINGQVIRTLVGKSLPPGTYVTDWDGKYENGWQAPNSIYLIEFRAGEFRALRKISLQR